jgi:hypothetical protein
MATLRVHLNLGKEGEKRRKQRIIERENIFGAVRSEVRGETNGVLDVRESVGFREEAEGCRGLPRTHTPGSARHI